MTDLLSETIADMVAAWPEFRMGMKRVGVTLAGGQTLDNVIISGSTVMKVLVFDDIPFDSRTGRGCQSRHRRR